jgi:hypothetical protein
MGFAVSVAVSLRNEQWVSICLLRGFIDHPGVIIPREKLLNGKAIYLLREHFLTHKPRQGISENTLE